MLVNVQALVPPMVRLSIKTSPAPEPTLLSPPKIKPSPLMGGVLAPVQLPLAPVPPQLAVAPLGFQVSGPFAAKAADGAAKPRRMASANRGVRAGCPIRKFQMMDRRVLFIQGREQFVAFAPYGPAGQRQVICDCPQWVCRRPRSVIGDQR